MDQFGWLSERGGGNFLNLLRKDEVSRKEGGSLRKGGGQPWSKLCRLSSINFTCSNLEYVGPDIVWRETEGSILGPLLFNIFICDLLFVNDTDIANCAENATPYLSGNKKK